MDLMKTLFYKTDESTNQLRLSKTKVISSIVFIIFFGLSLVFYLTSPDFKDTNILSLLIASIVFGLIFAVPTFIVGWILGKLLNRNKPKNYSIENNLDFNPMETVNMEENTNVKESIEDVPCPYDTAIKFKEAIEKDDSDLASNLLLKWDNNDANYKYASIIFEGMPPSDLSLNELNEMLKSADSMKACDESLREWFKSTALQVINLNKE